ncbi:MAG: hypothetical protein RLY16_37 [Bacteroidota bacterium]|jgi:hypothetical protein
MKKLIPFLAFFCLFLSSCTPNQDAEVAAITHVLEKESATWRAGDSAAHAACWQERRYNKILISTADGNSFEVPAAAIIHPNPTKMGKGGSSKNSNYQYALRGETAWVTHDETSISADGIVSKSKELRILEKVNGHWKLVGQSIHMLK